MTNLKNAYDALVASFEAVQETAERIEARFADGDVEGALALETELDEAQAKADSLSALYQKLTQVGDETPQQFFVPAAENPEPEAENRPLTRSEFEQMNPQAKAEYIAAGGKLTDDEE